MKLVTVKSCQVVAQGRQKKLQAQSCTKDDKLLLVLSKPWEDGESARVDPRHGRECLSQSRGLSFATLGKSFNLSPYHCSVSEMKINGSNAPEKLNVLVIMRGSDEDKGEINILDR